MSLSVVVPDPAILDTADLEALHNALKKCRRRKTLFSGEVVQGYVLYRSTTAQAPKNVQVSYSFEALTDQGLKPESRDPDEVTEVRAELVAQGASTTNENENITIWKFATGVSSPRLKIGKPVTFTASMIDPSVPTNGHVRAESETSEDSRRENTPQEVVEEHKDAYGPSTLKASETLALQLALMMKLKSTKPGGRNDILLSSLSIEASEDLLNFACERRLSNLQFTILNLAVDLPSGTVTKLSSMKTPAHFGIHDITSITYRLINSIDSQLKNEQPETTQPLHITLDIEITSGKDKIGSKISSTWTPILDFGLMAPPISNSLKSSSNISHSQMQLQFQTPQRLRSSQSLHKKTYLSTPTFNTLPSVPYINAPGTPTSKSTFGIPQRVKLPNPAPGRTQLTNALSQVSQSQPTLKTIKRNYRSFISQPPMASSAVTVNLTTTNNTSLSGLRLTFLGKLDVELGKIATLSIQAVNLSQRTLHLLLIVKNPLKPNPVYSNNYAAASSVSSSNVLGTKEASQQKVLVHNRQQLYHQYHQNKLETCGVIMLTNDVRLGPVEPNAVFESEFDIIGISKGVFNLQGLKIFDVSTGDGIDFGKLMEVFVT